jgi:outer membrane lipoprotein-sorting protein
LTVGSDTAGETSVTDGRFLVVYSKITHEYTKRQAAFPIAAAQQRALAALGGLHSDAEITSARIVRNERLSLHGSAFDCAVLEIDVHRSRPVEVRGSYSLWIEKKTGLALKHEAKFVRDQNGKATETRSNFIVRRIVLNQAIDDKVFEFTPPPDGKLVDKLTYSEAGGLVGKILPDMEFRNLDETRFNLESLTGKTVLMSFGTTTCEPWRTEIGQLARVRTSISDDTMIVLVDLNEAADAALRWWKANPADLPLILGRTTRFGSCPMNVIIGKDGKVVDAGTGVEADSETLAKIRLAMPSIGSSNVKK